MSVLYLKNFIKNKTQIKELKKEYSFLCEKYNEFFNTKIRNPEITKKIQDEIIKIHRQIKDLENQNKLSPEINKILKESDLKTLKKLYEKCHDEKIEKDDTINAIEEEIYLKYFEENNIKIDRIYILEKFDPKKKK